MSWYELSSKCVRARIWPASVAAGFVALAATVGPAVSGDAGGTEPHNGAQAPATAEQSENQSQPPANPPAPVQVFDIDEFRVDGAINLAQVEVEAAVYPFLGPKRNAQDVDKARAALEKAYHDKGLQTVSVSVPEQNVEPERSCWRSRKARSANFA